MNSPDTVRVPYRKLLAFTRATFSEHGLPPARAHTAAAALCYADLRGLAPHGIAELTGLHLPLLADGRADPAAEPVALHDTGACTLVEARGALGLWAASEAVDSAIDRAAQHGVGLVSVRGTTPFGCAGVHAIRATRDGMLGVLASTGGPAPSGPSHPVAAAAPALDQRPFVLDRSAALSPRDPGFPLPDPDGELCWPDEEPDVGQDGLGPFAPLLTAMLCGSTGSLPHLGGAEPDTTDFVALALDPGAICPGHDAITTARSLFTALAPRTPPRPEQGGTTGYPGWLEAERVDHALHEGVPLPRDLHEELVSFGLEDAEQQLVAV